jgi:two-component system response regulator AtoC
MAEPMRALVVDDDDPIRLMLAKVIGRENLAVDTARDGAEAIARIDAEADAYRVILLDLMMPRVDGFAVLDHLRKHHPEKLNCTIVVSAVPEGEVTRQLENQLRVHPKPFDLAKLVAQVRECVLGDP